MHLTRYTIENLVTGTEKTFVTLTSREPLKFPNKEHKRTFKVFNQVPQKISIKRLKGSL